MYFEKSRVPKKPWFLQQKKVRFFDIGKMVSGASDLKVELYTEELAKEKR